MDDNEILFYSALTKHLLRISDRCFLWQDCTAASKREKDQNRKAKVRTINKILAQQLLIWKKTISYLTLMEVPGEGLSKGALKLCIFKKDLDFSLSTMLKLYMVLLFLRKSFYFLLQWCWIKKHLSDLCRYWRSCLRIIKVLLFLA